METATVQVEADPGTDTTTVVEEPKEPREPVVMPAIKHGLQASGTAVADFNLRKVGRGLKSLGRKLPRVRIERSSGTTDAPAS